MQGATAPFISPWPTKLLMFGENILQSDQLHVPTNQFMSLEWQAAKPRTAKSMVFRFPVAVRFSQSVKFGSDMALLTGKGQLPIHSI